MDRKTSLHATNALTAASRRKRISRYLKEFGAAQIIPVTYCKLSEAISTRVLACAIRYYVTVTPLLRVNEQFAGTPTFRRSPWKVGKVTRRYLPWNVWLRETTVLFLLVRHRWRADLRHDARNLHSTGTLPPQPSDQSLGSRDYHGS